MVTMDVYGHLFPSVAEALTDGLDAVLVAAREAPAAVPLVIASRRAATASCSRRPTPGCARGSSLAMRLRGRHER